MGRFNTSVSFEDIEALLYQDNAGICLDCGEPHDNVEPDARGYTCTHCGARKVYGAQEVLLMGAYT